MFFADLHIHSSYSRATSRDLDAPHLDLWARNKGISLVGTGDFTHPAWRQALRDTLLPAEDGFYRLRDELRMEVDAKDADTPARFVISGEISSIYKKNGKTRKVHNVILLPSIEAADRLSRRLEVIGNIHSDGRPILGLDSRDLLEITLETCPNAIFIPAHIWTPHFSLFGAFSGFDTIEECFEDLTGEIHALETGLSSDPPMNHRISALDRFTFVSNSDAHSPSKLGREANMLSCALAYPAVKHAIETGDGFDGTIEFFPEEGKYHLDGHRNCGVCLEPEETERLGGRCPVCGKRLTIGVQHRAWELSDRETDEIPASAKPFESLVPLAEVIGASVGASAASKGVQQQYFRLLQTLGNEFSILRERSTEDIARASNQIVAEGIKRLREGKMLRSGGYDGAYGTIELFTEAERAALSGQLSLFGVTTRRKSKESVNRTTKEKRTSEAATDTASAAKSENVRQKEAITSAATALAVIAGPGTGKTYTLVARIAHLIEEEGVHPNEITAVTFTHQAAAEMRDRLAARLGKRTADKLQIGTFHAICQRLLDNRPLLLDGEKREIAQLLVRESGYSGSAEQMLEEISKFKNGLETTLDVRIVARYKELLESTKRRDFDDLLLDALHLQGNNSPAFSHLLVDEYQDINGLQRQLVQKWSEGGKSLFVIGDPDQSIYGFRGANAACFEELSGFFPSLVTIRLEQNYRSTPEVIGCALSAIKQNGNRDRDLTAIRESGEAVRFVRADDTLSEGIFIAKEIAKLVGGVDMLHAKSSDHALRAFSDIAILCRTRRQLLKIEECLRHDGIPCVVTGRDDALQDEAVISALRFFRALTEPSDRENLIDVLTKMYGMERSAAMHALERAEELGDLTDGDALLAGGLPTAFIRERSEFWEALQTESPRMLLERYAAKPNRIGKAHKEAFQALCDMAIFHRSMEEFLQMLLLGEEADIKRTDRAAYASGAVQLMTLHASKGLEFPVVFLAGLSEGLLPLTHGGICADMEEERRLFFVGITRARDALILTGCGAGSPFLSELPASVEKVRAASLHRIITSRQLSLF